jgi:NAD(P)-dependent dehydrogenase (short-subunit alcohol dehydrogenase family)
MTVDNVFAGRVALVTGASSGLGRATALALARAGAAVALVARSASELRAVADEVADADGKSAAVPADIADPAQISSAVELARSQLGRISVVVNAAGTDVPASIEELTVRDWDQVLNVNLRAPYLFAQAVFGDMRDLGGGTIVIVGSVAGRRAWPNAAAYCSSKFGLTGLTQVLNAEGRAHGIRACLLYPGGMDTNWGAWIPDDRGAGRRPQPAAEALPPAHVADLITWICAAPPDVVLNEATVTPLLEKGWP